ncbi:MAG: 16S rRNA (guanine(527)-N(7))-methyltransferase RsmG [Sulfitobacter sp.]
MSAVGEVDVSRETFEKLEAFGALVEKWTTKINLISKPSVPELWERHIVDSVQLFTLAPPKGHWVDMGSGGGFPGIVISILTAGKCEGHHVTLVESDQRKTVFLRTAIRELDLSSAVICDRIENIPNLHADIISARALADLTSLLGYADMHLKPEGLAVFPKGENWKTEHEHAQCQWSYACEPIKSATNPSAAVLKIKDIARV